MKADEVYQYFGLVPLEITDWDLTNSMGIFVCCLPPYRIIDNKIAVFTTNSEQINYLLHGKTKNDKQLWVMFSDKGKKVLHSTKLKSLFKQVFSDWAYNKLMQKYQEKHHYTPTPKQTFTDYAGRTWQYTITPTYVILKSKKELKVVPR